MRLGQRVVDAGGEVGAIGRTTDTAGDMLLGERRVQGLGVVRVDAVARKGEAGAILLERAAQRERAVLLLLRRPPRREGVPGVHGLVTKREIDRAPHRSATWPGDEIDEDHPAAVVLGREQIAAETDRLNLRLRRKPSAAEAIDANRRAGPAHFFQRRFHVVRIVRQGFDLLACEHVSEGIAARIERAVARILADHHVFSHFREVELHLAAGIATGPQAQVIDLPRLETRELGPD